MIIDGAWNRGALQNDVGGFSCSCIKSISRLEEHLRGVILNSSYMPRSTLRFAKIDYVAFINILLFLMHLCRRCEIIG